MEADNTLYKLRNFEFEFLQDILGKNNFGNVLEIGPGKFPINKFINVTKYLGIEKSNQNLELEIYTITDIDKNRLSNVETVFALNSIYFIEDIEKFYLELESLNPNCFIYILPTSSWRFWTTISAYIAFFTKKNKHKQNIINNSSNSFLDKLFLKRHGIRGNRFNELFYYRKNYWEYLFLNLHQGYEIKTKNIKIFYTGFNIFGDKISLSLRSKISNFLGCSSRLYILSKKN